MLTCTLVRYLAGGSALVTGSKQVGPHNAVALSTGLTKVFVFSNSDDYIPCASRFMHAFTAMLQCDWQLNLDSELPGGSVRCLIQLLTQLAACI